MTDPNLIRWFADISADDVALVGGHNTELEAFEKAANFREFFALFFANFH